MLQKSDQENVIKKTWCLLSCCSPLPFKDFKQVNLPESLNMSDTMTPQSSMTAYLKKSSRSLNVQ